MEIVRTTPFHRTLLMALIMNILMLLFLLYSNIIFRLVLLNFDIKVNNARNSCGCDVTDINQPQRWIVALTTLSFCNLTIEAHIPGNF